MENICRACSRFSKTLSNIFDHFRNNKLISDMVMECTSVKVHKNDGLPINICSSCLEKLNAAYDFRILVKESDVKLRSQYYSTVKDNLQQDNKFLYVDLPLVKEENLNYEGVKVNCLHREKLNEEKLEDIKVQNTCLSNDYGSDTEDKAAIDKMCESGYSNEMTENIIIKQEFNDDLHNRVILLDSHKTTNHEGLNNEQNNIASEKGKNLSSMQAIKESDLIVDFADLPPIKANMRKKTVFCKECNKYFGHCYFKIHIRNHNGDRPFKCDLCNKGFAKEFLLKTHRATHSENRPYACDVCGKGFKNLIALRAHSLRHRKERPVICEVCGKGFVDGAGLATHKVAHRTEKNYACSTCGKSFPSKSRLTQHAKQHSDDRPHVCSYCDTRFKYKRVLQKHVLIHTGERPYSCKICSKTFRQASVLTLHMRIHTGETPYPCHLCTCKFKYSHHLQKHMKLHE